MAERLVGVDSNALTYLVQAMSGDYNPSQDSTRLAPERVAMLRIYLYSEPPLCVTPAVKNECLRISDAGERDFHAAVAEIVLLDGPWSIDSMARDARVKQLLADHPRPADCQILAEAEEAGFNRVLTLDGEFVRNLSGRCRRTVLSQPSSHWRNLAIPPGTRPVRFPASGNPLADQDWWRI